MHVLFRKPQTTCILGQSGEEGYSPLRPVKKTWFEVSTESMNIEQGFEFIDGR